MKIGIVSDSHDNAARLASAVERAREWGAQAILHCGDVIGPNALLQAMAVGLPIHVVHGNNLGDIPRMAKLQQSADGNLVYYGGDASFELGGRRLFMTHYPHLARGMACTGDFDAVFCGHTHAAKIEEVANVLGARTPMVNPGTVAGLGAAATMALGDLGALSFEVVPLDHVD